MGKQGKTVGKEMGRIFRLGNRMKSSLKPVSQFDDSVYQNAACKQHPDIENKIFHPFAHLAFSLEDLRKDTQILGKGQSNFTNNSGTISIKNPTRLNAGFRCQLKQGL
jgi:hypothetical protein